MDTKLAQIYSRMPVSLGPWIFNFFSMRLNTIHFPYGLSVGNYRGPVAQLVERVAVNRKVGGSKPPGTVYR